MILLKDTSKNWYGMQIASSPRNDLRVFRGILNFNLFGQGYAG